ncbi:hypothetical protein [Salinispora arenicola]|uniref:hypothetical protein n=1 Tax=Salinispora arenicola TaxID=168697 RepID=UPI00057735A0|nr:hypothetical protein [Salinispora arenicola]
MTGKDTNTAMNDQRYDHELDRPGARWARSRWWAVGLAGMTGLALTASLGIGGAPAIGAVDGTVTAADGRPGRPDRASTDNQDHKGKAKQGKRRGTPVPCSADALIAAITLANARGGAVLDLAKDCTYLLTANIDDGAGLPVITAPITLNGGKHTSITRAAAAEQFRIFTVQIGGHLTLNHLTITGGEINADGGGVLVISGGALTANHSTITRNVANDGGGIDNFGVTTINHSIVSHNISQGFGGGVSNSQGTLNINNSHITANTSSEGGGVVSFDMASAVTIRKSVFADNFSRGGSGGLAVRSGIGQISDTTFTNNRASNFAGGVYIDRPATLRNVEIVKNTALTRMAGGLFVDINAAVVVDKSLIKDNDSIAAIGGGVYNTGQLVMRKTTVIGNRADQGGGIYNDANGTLPLFSTKIVKNVAILDGGGIFNNGGTVELNTVTGTTVVKNRPDNCSGDVPGCAG